MPKNGPDHDDLRDLGARLDEVRRRDEARKVQPPVTNLGIAFRFSTELFAATIVGAGLGWGLDRLIGTKFPVCMLVLGVLGAVAGVRNVMRAAKEINAQIAQKPDEEK
jgi:ATP synthase protein I